MTRNPDEMLLSIRKKIMYWESAAARSPSEHEAAEGMTAEFALLDAWLTGGGYLPRAWRYRPIASEPIPSAYDGSATGFGGGASSDATRLSGGGAGDNGNQAFTALGGGGGGGGGGVMRPLPETPDLTEGIAERAVPMTRGLYARLTSEAMDADHLLAMLDRFFRYRPEPQPGNENDGMVIRSDLLNGIDGPYYMDWMCEPPGDEYEYDITKYSPGGSRYGHPITLVYAYKLVHATPEPEPSEPVARLSIVEAPDLTIDEKLDNLARLQAQREKDQADQADQDEHHDEHHDETIVPEVDIVDELSYQDPEILYEAYIKSLERMTKDPDQAERYLPTLEERTDRTELPSLSLMEDPEALRAFVLQVMREEAGTQSNDFIQSTTVLQDIENDLDDAPKPGLTEDPNVIWTETQIIAEQVTAMGKFPIANWKDAPTRTASWGLLRDRASEIAWKEKGFLLQGDVHPHADRQQVSYMKPLRAPIGSAQNLSYGDDPVFVACRADDPECELVELRLVCWARPMTPAEERERGVDGNS